MQVELVGGEDEVELMEIRGVYLACAEFRQVVPTQLRVSNRAGIRRVADVVIFRSGGIELDG